MKTLSKLLIGQLRAQRENHRLFDAVILGISELSEELSSKGLLEKFHAMLDGLEIHFPESGGLNRLPILTLVAKRERANDLMSLLKGALQIDWKGATKTPEQAMMWTYREAKWRSVTLCVCWA